MGWQIVDWEMFEITGDMRSSNKFRAGMDYLQLPTCYNSDKLIQLLDKKKQGLCAFAVWVLLAEVWASQKREKRHGGVIWSWQDGRPASNSELAKKLHLPTRLLDVLCPLLQEINWLVPYPVITEEIPGKDSVNTPIDIDSLYKKKKDLNKDKDKIQIRTFVKITQVEYDKLVTEYGKSRTKKMLDKLDNFKGSKGKHYKDDYRAILSWVVEAVPPGPEDRGNDDDEYLQMVEKSKLEHGVER